jgi:adenylate cyclase
MSGPSNAIRFPIAIKLILISIGLLLCATFLITYQSSKRFEQISMDREEDNNRFQSSTRATEVEGLLVGFIDKTKMVAGLVLQNLRKGVLKHDEIQTSVNQDRDLVFLQLFTTEGAVEGASFTSEGYLTSQNLSEVRLSSYLNSTEFSKAFSQKSVLSGQVEILSVPLDKTPLIAIGIPLAVNEAGEFTHGVLALIRQDRLQKAFKAMTDRVIYLTDARGNLIAHPDESLVLKTTSLASVPVVAEALRSNFKQGQIHFEDQLGSWSAAFAKTSIGPVVVAQASKESILAAAKAVRREAIYIAGQVVSFAIILIFIFSITLTSPIEKLSAMTQQVAIGNFAARSGVRTSDEVGKLAFAFDQMAVGLEERDKIKNVLNKFHGSSIAQDLVKGQLELRGTRKEVTVFFSDIRGFTKFSEGHSPEEVVKMLNEYFQVMVSIITRYGGVVDKFIGDAIMAVWGAPNATSGDAQNAVKACLEMRQALEKLNESRVKRGLTEIMIGMGLHSGTAISGIIGSDERMEYTVIGDAVNMAARIEAATKSFGTDLLLSHDIQKRVQSQFLIEKAGDVEAKGKSEPMALYKVNGYLDFKKNPVIIRTKYSEYTAEADAKIKVQAG